MTIRQFIVLIGSLAIVLMYKKAVSRQKDDLTDAELRIQSNSMASVVQVEANLQERLSDKLQV